MRSNLEVDKGGFDLSGLSCILFEVVRQPDGNLAFPFVSEGVRLLLDLEPDHVKANGAVFWT